MLRLLFDAQIALLGAVVVVLDGLIWLTGEA